ncbi:MAG: putative transport system permease protein [Solirubrobacterales bacterium]|jgi:putative ABC transport system permease protein|nr:putative transport system permease protein [Solirubrobacterales bacterium]
MTLSLSWLAGLIAHRRSRVIATAIGVAIGVALLASIGTFLSSTTSKMTDRAVQSVPVDWQVEAQPGANPAKVIDQTRNLPGVSATATVRFASTNGLTAATGQTVQRTGPGQVLSMPASYPSTFPGSVRLLAGSLNGPLLAQQTAANVQARPGDQVKIGRPGLGDATVRIAGVVELPAADSLFQKVGAPPGAQLQAPPDNVVILPPATFQRVEGPLASARPDLVRTQVHATLDQAALPSSPSAAFTQVSGQAKNLEVKLAGAGLVGDNLGSALDHARGDALYAQILFLFLGVPGAILAGLITASIASAGAERRRRDQGLLRTRGATTNQLVRMALAETALAGGIGIALGLAGALGIGALAFGTASFGAGSLAAVLWATGAAIAGLVIAATAITLPAWREARSLTVAGARRSVGRPERSPWWMRARLDFLALAGAALVYWQASRNGYQLVLAPEGLPQVQVNWYALLAPVLLWIGGGLLAYRLADLLLFRGRRILGRGLKPLAGNLSPTVAATMGRQRRLLARSLTLVALTVAFAGSTAVFNSTYAQQAEADARLTNGADVTVTESPGANVGPSEAATLAKVQGVSSVEPLQHRFAYVGADLQDLYGVNPTTIGAAGQLQNGWFQGGSTDQLLSTLGSKPDSILVSAETVKDFQLHPGDLLRLRLQNGLTKQYTTVPFHYAGIAKEFPTAPRDSFLVANASYVAQQTGSNAVGSFLIQTDGTSPATVASRVQSVVGTGAKVTDITSSRQVIGTSLTSVELSGLTKVELAFALVLAAASTGLVLGLGFAERRRSFAIASALGARAKQLGAFAWSEATFVTAGGLLLGGVIATGLSVVLVKVLTGVFDPPPDVLSVPWLYLGTVAGVAMVAVVLATLAMLHALRRPQIETLRDL